MDIEDRLRTVLENLRTVRECAEQTEDQAIRVQLASCDPLLKRLEQLTFNAVGKARNELEKHKRMVKLQREEDAKLSASEKRSRKK